MRKAALVATEQEGCGVVGVLLVSSVVLEGMRCRRAVICMQEWQQISLHR